MVTVWKIPPMWKGEEVWIIGGGPSITESFDIPEQVVKNVRFKREPMSAFSPYLAALHKKKVIGINAAFRLGDWVDICFFGDKGFYLKNAYSLSRFPKLVVTCSGYVGTRENWIKYLPTQKYKIQNTKKKFRKSYGISENNRAVCWNENSGAASISLAAWLGAKRIILLGFDMNMGNKNRTHFHTEYYKNPNVKPKVLPFTTHLKGFPTIKKDADERGIEIINASLDSAIEVFPKVHVKDLL